MANSKITWNDKVSLVTDPTIAEINKVTDDNMNEIKSVVNENADQLIVSDTEPTSNDNEIWLDTSDTIPYINSEVNIGATNVSNTPLWFKQSKNLFNQNVITENKFYYITNNAIVDNPNWNMSDFIAVKPNEKYTLSCQTNSNNMQFNYSYYNASKSLLGGEGSTTTKEITYTIPSNAVYIRIGYRNDQSATNIQLEKGSTATAYEPYVRKAININGKDEYYTNDYSTEEQVIGTWLGKPLYREVVNFTISSTWQDVGTFSNVDFFTKIQLVRKTGGNAYPYYQDSNNYCYAYIPATKTRIILASSSNENGNAGSLIVEYTKTTD